MVSVLLCVMAVGLGLAQHWSFGLQPGGKRSPEVLPWAPLQEVGAGLGKQPKKGDKPVPVPQTPPDLGINTLF